MGAVVPPLREAIKGKAPTLALEREIWEGGARVVVGLGVLTARRAEQARARARLGPGNKGAEAADAALQAANALRRLRGGAGE